MSLSEFIECYGTQALCETALEHARWPDGFVCPECGERAHSRFLADGRQYWQCSRCRTQSTVCSGTLFHASKLPLTKWFQAIYLVTQNKNNLSALSLKRHLGVAYATAWRVKHKLLEAMRQRESRRLLQGVVFADDAVLGGEHAGKPGRGSENKAPFMAAVELDDDGHPGRVRFDAIADYTGETFGAWAKSALHPDVHLVTDGLASFNAAGAQVAAHGAIIVGKLVPYALVGAIEMATALPVVLFWFQVPLRGSLLTLIVLTVPFVLCTLGLGLLVSTLARTQQQLGHLDDAMETYQKLSAIGGGHFRQDDMLASSMANMANASELTVSRV